MESIGSTFFNPQVVGGVDQYINSFVSQNEVIKNLQLIYGLDNSVFASLFKEWFYYISNNNNITSLTNSKTTVSPELLKTSAETPSFYKIPKDQLLSQDEALLKFIAQINYSLNNSHNPLELSVVSPYLSPLDLKVNDKSIEYNKDAQQSSLFTLLTNIHRELPSKVFALKFEDIQPPPKPEDRNINNINGSQFNTSTSFLEVEMDKEKITAHPKNSSGVSLSSNSTNNISTTNPDDFTILNNTVKKDTTSLNSYIFSKNVEILNTQSRQENKSEFSLFPKQKVDNEIKVANSSVPLQNLNLNNGGQTHVTFSTDSSFQIQRIVEVVNDSIKNLSLIKHDSVRLQIHLSTSDIVTVDVKLQNNTLNINIDTNNSTLGQFLSSNTEILRNNLNSGNYILGSVSVNISGGANSFNQNMPKGNLLERNEYAFFADTTKVSRDKLNIKRLATMEVVV